MVELASKQDTRFVASRLEDPSGTSGPHYSIDTFQRVRESSAPGNRLFFVLGADAFAEIKLWYRWREVVGMVGVHCCQPGGGNEQPARRS